MKTSLLRSKKLKAGLKKLFPLVASPRNNIGSPFLNKSGLQVLRVLQKKAAWNARSQQGSGLSDNHQRALDEEGIVVIPDFFPEEIFRKIEKECAQFRQSPFLVTENNRWNSHVDWSHGGIPPHLEDYQTIKNHFRQNDLILKLASYVARRKMSSLPSVHYEHLSVPVDQVDDQDDNTILHTDRFYYSPKAILYMDDVPKDGGALIYCPGSHKISRNRIAHEYEMSYREALHRYGRTSEIPENLVEKGRPAASLKVKASLRPTQIYGKKNTLILFNTCGFHARGQIPSGATRTALRMVFHYLQAPYLVRKTFQYLNLDPTLLS